MCISIIPTAPWSQWRNEVQQTLDCPHVWNRSTGCRNLHSARALPRASRIEDPLRDGLKACCSDHNLPKNASPSRPPHHQCADPGADSLSSPHLRINCTDLAEDSCRHE